MNFAQIDDLNKHVKRVHENTKEYQCNRCEKWFSTRGNLNFHIKTVHNLIKPFECDTCDRQFNDKRLLKKHVKMYTEPCEIL